MQVFRACYFRYGSERGSLWHGDIWAENWNKQERDIWMNLWGLSWHWEQQMHRRWDSSLHGILEVLPGDWCDQNGGRVVRVEIRDVGREKMM